MAEMTPADVRAMTTNKDSFFGGDGFYGLIVLFFIFAMFGGGGLWGGNAAAHGALTRAEMYEGFNTAEIQRNQNDLMRGQFDVQKEILESRYTTQLGFQAAQAQQAQCCCDLKTAIHAEAEATRALINSNTMQELRDKLADRDRDLQTANFQLSQQAQSANIIGTLRPFPQPAYITYSPYQSAQACGYNGCC